MALSTPDTSMEFGRLRGAIGSLPSFEDGNERKMDFSFIPLSVSMKSFPRVRINFVSSGLVEAKTKSTTRDVFYLFFGLKHSRINSRRYIIGECGIKQEKNNNDRKIKSGFDVERDSESTCRRIYEANSVEDSK